MSRGKATFNKIKAAQASGWTKREANKGGGRGSGNSQGGIIMEKTISRSEPDLDAVEKALGGTVTKTVTKQIGGAQGGGRGGNKNQITKARSMEYAEIARGTASIARQMAQQLMPGASEAEIDKFILSGVQGVRGTMGGSVDINPGLVIQNAATKYAKLYPDQFKLTPEISSWLTENRNRLQGRSKDIWKSVSGGGESFFQAISPYVGMAASAFAPGLSNLLGGGITGGAASGGLIGGGMAALQGGDIGKGLLTGAVGGAIGASNIGKTLGTSAGQALGVTNPITQNSINQGINSAIRGTATGLISGKDLGESLKGGLLSGVGTGASSMLAGNLRQALAGSGGLGVNKDLTNFLAGTAGGTLSGVIRGQDFKTSLMNSAIGSAANTAGAMAGRYADTGNPGLDKTIGQGVSGMVSNFAKSALAPSPVARPTVMRPMPLRPLVQRPTGMVTQQPMGMSKQQIMALLARMTPQQRQALMVKMQGGTANGMG